MKGKFKKELKLFALVFGLAILSGILRRYIPEEMFTTEQVNIIIFIVSLVLGLQSVSDNMRYKVTWIGLIVFEFLVLLLFLSLLYFILSLYTFKELLSLFLFVYTIFKMIQVIRYHS